MCNLLCHFLYMVNLLRHFPYMVNLILRHYPYMVNLLRHFPHMVKLLRHFPYMVNLLRHFPYMVNLEFFLDLALSLTATVHLYSFIACKTPWRVPGFYPWNSKWVAKKKKKATTTKELNWIFSHLAITKAKVDFYRWKELLLIGWDKFLKQSSCWREPQPKLWAWLYVDKLSASLSVYYILFVNVSHLIRM